MFMYGQTDTEKHLRTIPFDFFWGMGVYTVCLHEEKMLLPNEPASINKQPTQGLLVRVEAQCAVDLVNFLIAAMWSDINIVSRNHLTCQRTKSTLWGQPSLLPSNGTSLWIKLSLNSEAIVCSHDFLKKTEYEKKKKTSYNNDFQMIWHGMDMERHMERKETMHYVKWEDILTKVKVRREKKQWTQNRINYTRTREHLPNLDDYHIVGTTPECQFW